MVESNSENSDINRNHLEEEKRKFLSLIYEFIGDISFEDENQINGRPKTDVRDVLKAMLVMSYHSWSYRRANSDIEKMKDEGLIDSVPKRATLSKYMRDPEFKKKLEFLIELTAQTFLDVEDCFIIDSSQFSKMPKMSSANYARSLLRNQHFAPLTKTRKLHIVICKNSKVIVCAKTSGGVVHDNVYFTELVERAIHLGFKIKTLLADAGYNSKENYLLCENYDIDAYIDFKSNHTINRSKSFQRKRKLIMYRTNPGAWLAQYRYRPIIETVFSSIKRKGKSYIRSRVQIAQDSEMLLRALSHNFTIMAKHNY